VNAPEFEIASISTAGRFTHRLIQSIVVIFTKVLWRQEVDGTERLPTGVPYVIAPVHRSYVDFLIVSAAVPRVQRFMAKDSVWKYPLGGRFLAFIGAFPVNREAADRAAIRRCDDAIKGGDPIVMFPEGRREFGPEVQELYHGPAWVACRNRVPIVPIAIGGSDRAMPRGAKMVYPARVRVLIGEPIYPDVVPTGHVPRRVVTELTATLHDEMQRLYDQVR
jgi:1-acyl-sn-glycerol-3-phosphate acyltransferase